MKRHLYIMMLSLVAAVAADDPGGWTKAKWGMTTDQLAAAFGSDAIQLEPPEKVSGIPVRISVPVELAQIPCRALMLPDQAGKLDTVLITPAKPADQTDGFYQDLQDLLVQKYSRPWKASEEGGITELQWTVGSTVITLTRGKLPLTTRRIVNLKYERKSSLEKL